MNPDSMEVTILPGHGDEIEPEGFKSHSKVLQGLRHPPQYRILVVPNRGKRIRIM